LHSLLKSTILQTSIVSSASPSRQSFASRRGSVRCSLRHLEA
jgi:hypothetical protein